MAQLSSPFDNRAAYIAITPTLVAVFTVYICGIAWSVWMSFTSSKLLPVHDFVGLAQYDRLFSTSLWGTALSNLGVFTALFVSGSLAFGYVLAACLDRGVRFERLFVTIILMPSALSFIVVGLAWKWLLDPGFGIQNVVQGWGWDGFRFDLASHRATAIYAIVLAAIWHSAGMAMVILLAGMRMVSSSVWKAAAVDGIASWRIYVWVVPAVIWPQIMTTTTLLFVASVKMFEIIVALTGGGPGTATEMPATFVLKMLFSRSNAGQASAAAVVLLVVTVAGLMLLRWGLRRYRRSM